MNEEDTLKFDIPTDAPRIIKVIGVGGGGGNAVQNMYREGIHNVSFVVCNTDSQALANSPIPSKVQLGEKVTEGLGAGNDPEVGREAAEESRAKIESLFNDGTKMVFITAGMGGGTGTGAAPVVAEIAKGLNILTIGIVTIPFKFEMGNKIHQALKGVTEISKHVDALLVINNQRLLDIYPELTIDDGLCKVDEVLTTATKSIAEIITARGTINLDFRDVSRVLKNGGVAIMSYGIEKGEQRLALAFEKALHSPLLNNNDIYKSKKILFNIYYNPNHPLKIGEIEEVNSFMAQFTEEEIEVIWGISKDYSLEDGAVKVTVLATGFSMHNIPEMQPLLNEEEREREMQEEKIKSMKDAFYKEDFKIYIFDDSELDNESLISAVESLPTHKRMAKDMQQIKNISSEAKKAYEPEYEQASEENVTINMDPEENPANDNSVEISYYQIIMDIFDIISNDLKEAMKAKDKVALDTLRNIKKALLEAKTAPGAGDSVDDATATKIISKLAKQGRESAELFASQNRPELAAEELAQVAVLEKYLPKQMSDEELTAALKSIIAEVGASTPQEMGKVMGVATKKLAGMADGKAISAKVRELLA